MRNTESTDYNLDSVKAIWDEFMKQSTKNACYIFTYYVSHILVVSLVLYVHMFLLRLHKCIKSTVFPWSS